MTMNIMISEEIENLDDLENKYQEKLDELSTIPANLLTDKNTRYYYKFCLKGKDTIDSFMKFFGINENKDSFLERVNKNIEDVKKEFFAEIGKDIDITTIFYYQEYTPDVIKRIVSFVLYLQKKNNKSFNFVIKEPNDGLKKSDVENLLNLSNHLKQDILMYASDSFGVPLSKVIEAYGKIDDIVDEINSKKLSPFEKFLIVHDYAANKVYKMEYDQDRGECASIVYVMTGDGIICGGYAQIMETLCKRLGIECQIIEGLIKPSENTCTVVSGHAANIVRIVDEKYGIDDFYFCDSCWDSKQTSDEKGKKYFYAALPIQDMEKISSSKFFCGGYSYLNTLKRSKPIPVNTFRKALNKIYSNKEQVEEDLQNTIKNSCNKCAKSAENDFNQEYNRQREQLLISKTKK